MTQSEASKNEFNRPKGGETCGPRKGNSMHKTWTSKGPGEDGARGAGENVVLGRHQGPECLFGKLHFILGVQP